MAITLQVNGQTHQLDAPEQMPLLWAVRDLLGLTGSKFGCGIAQCGACTMLIDDQPVRSCVMPIAAVAGQKVTTIEGLATEGKLSTVQQAWLDEQVPQCGYCQSGMILAATALLNTTAAPTDSQIDQAMTNICRCGTYNRVRAAIHRAAKQAATAAAPARSDREVQHG